jgi:hypothetical protein
MFDDLERVEELRAFQQISDITQVAAPSSTTTCLMVYIEYSMWIWKEHGKASEASHL